MPGRRPVVHADGFEVEAVTFPGSGSCMPPGGLKAGWPGRDRMALVDEPTWPELWDHA